MDITDMFAPTSDQMDAVDLVDSPRTLTVKDVTPGPSDKQPLNVHFADFPRPWRPNKGTGRFLKAYWGKDTTLWHGRRITLFNDPSVWYAKENTGGIRISHMSNIDKPVTMPNLERGKTIQRTVQPLKEPARAESVTQGATNKASTASDQAETATAITNAATPDELMAIWEASDKSPKTRELMKARKAELDADA